MEGTTTSSWHYTSIRDQQPHHARKQCENAPKIGKGSNRLNYIPQIQRDKLPEGLGIHLMTREDPMCYTLCNQSRRPYCGFSPSLRKV